MRIITRGVPRSRTSYSKYLSNSPARHYSHSSNSSPKAFTFASQQKDGDALLSQLREKLGSANSESYDAAVVLGTPGLARLLANDSFIGGLSSSLLTLSSEKGTHVVTAAVDRLAPVGSVAVEEGISVLRGRVDDIMPGIWNPQAPRPKEDADTVSALTFGLSDGSITLPLARTVFYHQRVSTLVATCFQTSDTAALTVARQTEPRLAHINLPTSATMADASFQLPLIPLTHARKVLESFGNIVRGVEVGGKRTPGSTELEEIANKMYSLDNYAPEAGPMSIWALVTPGTETAETSQLVEPDPGEMFELLSSGKGLEQLTSRTSEYVAQRHRQGGRLYKLLSGGGGWGQKAGLLALDPQLTHFAQSDEEAMEKFLSFSQGHQHLGYVPPGSRIQFFAGAPPSVNFRSEGKEGYLFGVQRETSSVLDETNQDKLWLGRFGALSSSSSGIFLKNHGSSLSEPDSRITVPGSLLAISS